MLSSTAPKCIKKLFERSIEHYQKHRYECQVMRFMCFHMKYNNTEEGKFSILYFPREDKFFRTTTETAKHLKNENVKLYIFLFESVLKTQLTEEIKTDNLKLDFIESFCCYLTCLDFPNNKTDIYEIERANITLNGNTHYFEKVPFYVNNSQY